MRRVMPCVALLVALGACADDRREPPEPVEQEAIEAMAGVADRPEVEIPEDEPPPDELVVEELIEGDGPTVEEDDVVTIHVVGLNWATGERVVSSWDRGAPRTFAVDALIPGVREAITDVAVGSRLRVVVPPELGYGEDAPSGIGAHDTVVFVIDVVSLG